MTDLDQSPAQPFDILTEGPTVGPVRNYNPSSGTGTPGGVDGNVQYNQAGTFGGLTNTQLTTKINIVGSATSGAAPASGGGTANFLRADGTFAQPLPQPTTITYSMLQNVSTNPRFLGRISSGAGSVEELTGTQAATFIDLFTSGLRGQVPASGGGATNFLRADGVWVSPGSSGSPGGASGQVQFNNAGSFGGFTFSGDATVDTSTGIITIANDAVTYAKIQNIVANNVVLGNISGANQNTAELTGTQVTALLDTFTTSLKGLVPSSGGGSVNFLRADGTWVPPPGGSGGTPGGALNTIQWNSAGTFAGFTMNGDATLVPSTGVITIANQAVTYAKVQNISATSRFLGRITAGAGSTEELTGTQATTLLDNFTSVLKGVVPASGGGTTNFLRADGTWVAPGGAGAPGGVSGQVQYNNSGSFGGFTVGGDATLNTGSGVLTISNLAVTYAKMQNVVNNNRILGNVAGAAQPVVELTGTQATTVLDQFTNVLKGVVPGSGGGTTNFLRADGTWAAPGGAGAPGGTTLQLQYNNAGAFGGMSGTSWDNTNRSLTLTGATVTTSNPIENYTQTWNAGGVTFTGLNYNFTDTASSVNSRFVAYQIGGVDKYVVRKDGSVTSGIWLATPVDAPRGGTGQSSYAIGDTLYASATTALSKLPGNTTTTQKFLSQTGTGAASQAPVWTALTAAGIGAINTVSPTVRGGYPAWNTTLGTIQDGQGILNALAYGADNTNSGPNAVATRIAIQNALNTGKMVYLPQGTYQIDTGVTIPSSGGGLIGEGEFSTFITSNATTGDVVTISNNAHWVWVGGMTITRASLATSGAGLKIGGVGSENDWVNIFNVRVTNHNIGFDWGGGTSWAQNLLTASNRSHGMQLTGGATSIQWQLLNVFSEANGGDGFHMVGSGSTPCGQWRGLATDSNSGFGFNCTGIAAVRLSDSFIGNDALGEIKVDIANDTTTPYNFTNVYCECAINGNGFTFTSNCLSEVHLVNCSATTGAAGNGLVSAAPLTMITNGAFIAKAAFGASTGSGIVITGARASIVGTSALGFGGTGNIVASGITAVSIHACRANALIVTAGTATLSLVGNY